MLAIQYTTNIDLIRKSAYSKHILTVSYIFSEILFAVTTDQKVSSSLLNKGCGVFFSVKNKFNNNATVAFHKETHIIMCTKIDKRIWESIR